MNSTTCRSTAIILLAVCLYVGFCEASSVVIELTDNTFEHDTQATTGSTTGDWFVEFYAPWCGHCKKLVPAFEQLAADLSGVVNIAKLDATANRLTASRFGIKGFPTLYFLKSGKAYKFAGNRSVEEMTAFIQGGFKKVEPITIPSEPSAVGQFIAQIKSLSFESFMVVQKSPLAAGALFSGGLVVGLFVGVSFAWVFLSSPGQSAKGGRKHHRE